MNRWVRLINSSGFKSLHSKIQQLQKELTIAKQAQSEPEKPKLSDDGFQTVRKKLTHSTFLTVEQVQENLAEEPAEKPIREIYQKPSHPPSANLSEDLFPIYVVRPQIEISVTCTFHKRVMDLVDLSDDSSIFQLLAFKKKVRALTSMNPGNLLNKPNFRQFSTENLALDDEKTSDDSKTIFQWNECGRTEIKLGTQSLSNVSLFFFLSFSFLFDCRDPVANLTTLSLESKYLLLLRYFSKQTHRKWPNIESV